MLDHSPADSPATEMINAYLAAGVTWVDGQWVNTRAEKAEARANKMRTEVRDALARSDDLRAQLEHAESEIRRLKAAIELGQGDSPI